MAFDDLPPDPYRCLGVSKDATLAEIRSAHRKLVLKCHPDKVQDPALKAVKQDEFQKVQQAYEILSDETSRSQYDDKVKLWELRKEMSRGNPTARSNPFEYEIKVAEPRPSTFTTYPRRPAKESTKVYPDQLRPKSYENVDRIYDYERRPKKSASYESQDRERKSKSRDEDRLQEMRRREDEERARAKWEKESRRSAHGEKKKRCDKEKRRSAEEKHSSRTVYVEDDFSDDYRPSQSKEKLRQERHRLEEETRMRNEEARAQAARKAAQKAEPVWQAPLTPKWDSHKEYAAQYMQASRRKAPATTEEFQPRPPLRAETFSSPSTQYNVRYETAYTKGPYFSPSDDDTARRSSAGRSSRRVSDTPSTARAKESSKSSTKEKEREKERKRTVRSRSRDAYANIVEPPSPPLPKTKPSLQSSTPAPPIITDATPRKEPSRSKTQDYPRSKDPNIPSLARASTFQAGDRWSRLKTKVEYTTESDSNSPPFIPNHRSHSPTPLRRSAPEPVRYVVDNGRSVPLSTRQHRSELRHIDADVPYPSRERDRSESPLGKSRHSRTSERPPLSRTMGSSGTRPSRSHSQTYYPIPNTAPEPFIQEVRPKMPSRESTTYVHSRGHSSHGGSHFDKVQYAPPLKPENIIYSDTYRAGSEPAQYPSHGGTQYSYNSLPRDHIRA